MPGPGFPATPLGSGWPQRSARADPDTKRRGVPRPDRGGLKRQRPDLRRGISAARGSPGVLQSLPGAEERRCGDQLPPRRPAPLRPPPPQSPQPPLLSLPGSACCRRNPHSQSATLARSAGETRQTRPGNRALTPQYSSRAPYCTRPPDRQHVTRTPSPLPVPHPPARQAAPTHRPSPHTPGWGGGGGPERAASQLLPPLPPPLWLSLLARP